MEFTMELVAKDTKHVREPSLSDLAPRMRDLDTIDAELRRVARGWRVALRCWATHRALRTLTSCSMSVQPQPFLGYRVSVHPDQWRL
jgi:hypothetical protein